jgi:hypothetical protein
MQYKCSYENIFNYLISLYPEFLHMVTLMNTKDHLKNLEIINRERKFTSTLFK